VALWAAALSAGVPLGHRVGTLATEHLRRVEDWIDAHLGTPIALGRICSVAGVGERALQKAFLPRHGRSPMRYVAERRVLAAHRHLSRPVDGSGGVTKVALSVGFDHLGRFAVLYRQIVGESPSSTLRKALGAAAANVLQ